MAVKLNEHFTYKRIFKATILPIILCIFTSLYCVVDGFCIANFEGQDAFAGVNLIFPIIMIIGCFGFMFGSGGVALVGKYLGQKKQYEANNAFTNIVIAQFVVGLVLSIITFFFIEPLSRAMANVTANANEQMIKEATKYGKIMILGQPLFMTQNVFSIFFLLDEKPKISFIATIGAGLTNMLLDFLFIGVFKWGTLGAGAATIAGYIVASVYSIVYFVKEKNGVFTFVKPKLALKDLGQTCFNGISEFATNAAGSIVSIIFNLQLLRYYGDIGVSAYGALMYIVYIFYAFFFGYGSGMAPFISYNFGEDNKAELNNILKKSLIIITVLGLAIVTLCGCLADALAYLFCSGDKDVEILSAHATRVFAISFVFTGFSIFMSGWFTALNNGLISAIIALFRSAIFQVAFVYVLPLLIGKEGIWISVIGAEAISTLLSFIFLLGMNKKYGYLPIKSNKKPANN